MLDLKQICPNQKRSKKKFILLENKGFTLIELLLGVSISGILVLSLYFIFNYSVKTSKIGEEKEEFLLNGRYAIEYMKREIRNGEEIISSDKINGFNKKYKNNFGFVIKVKRDQGYKYVSYYLEKESIRRIVSINTASKYPYIGSFEGHNRIVGNISSIEGSRVDFKNNKIVLNFLMSGEWNNNMEFKTEIFMRCPTDY